MTIARSRHHASSFRIDELPHARTFRFDVAESYPATPRARPIADAPIVLAGVCFRRNSGPRPVLLRGHPPRATANSACAVMSAEPTGRAPCSFPVPPLSPSVRCRGPQERGRSAYAGSHGQAPRSAGHVPEDMTHQQTWRALVRNTQLHRRPTTFGTNASASVLRPGGAGSEYAASLLSELGLIEGDGQSERRANASARGRCAGRIA